MFPQVISRNIFFGIGAMLPVVAGFAAPQEGLLDLWRSNETSQSRQTAHLGGGHHTATAVREVHVSDAFHDPSSGSHDDFACDDDLGVQQQVLPASTVSPQQATQVIHHFVEALSDVVLQSRPHSVPSGRTARSHGEAKLPRETFA